MKPTIVQTVIKSRVPPTYFTWGHSVPLNSANTLHKVNGINLLVTRRNYYYASEDKKIRYKTMSAKNSSAEYYADVYAEIYPGLYQRIDICTNYSCSEVFEKAAQTAKLWKKDSAAIEIWRKRIVIID